MGIYEMCLTALGAILWIVVLGVLPAIEFVGGAE